MTNTGTHDPHGTATTATGREALRRRYARERDKRLRPDGNSQYIRLAEHSAEAARDPYEPMAARRPVTDDVTFAFIGGGFAGLMVGARLAEAGIPDVRIIDKAGGFGGTWYWNRYPGAMCDTASLVYMPLLEETGYRPTEKYAHGPEILAHCHRIAEQYGLYDNALFHTEVTSLEWDDGRDRWVVGTDRGDRFTARFIGMGTGPLHVAKLPGIPGIDDFRGRWFHTSRWDYAYTGGDPSGAPLDRLADKRVAVIGTGATAVQCVPELAKYCGDLYVFQRTPSSVDVRDNRPLDADWFAGIATPGWQQRWRDNFTENWEGVLIDPARTAQPEDLVQDGWTDLARRFRDILAALPPDERTGTRILQALEDADNEKMTAIRARVDEVVEDPETAAALKPWYWQLCKRPCFHDAYLQAFNRPNTHLVDTDGKGVERITETGVVAAGREYPVDCIVYASGFEVGTEFTRRAGYDPVGRGGVRLSEYWADGMRTLYGLFVRGFPNLFLVQLGQGANLVSNVPTNFAEAAKTVAATVRHTLDGGLRTFEAGQQAQDAWLAMLLERGRPNGSPDCTPGYYNNEGERPGPRQRLNVGYPDGAGAFFALMDRWRASGEFDGLVFTGG